MTEPNSDARDQGTGKPKLPLHWKMAIGFVSGLLLFGHDGRCGRRRAASACKIANDGRWEDGMMDGTAGRFPAAE